MLSTSIQTVTEAEEHRAIAALTAAFITDPLNRWMLPGTAQYLEHFPDGVRMMGAPAFRSQTAFGTDDLAGAALWMPPGVHVDEEAMGDYVERTLPPEKMAGFVKTFEEAATYHPEEPHWYLAVIGVDPVHQNRGYGARLLRHVLDRCDTDGVPAYLESSNERNHSFYQRHGFELLGTIQVGDTPPLWPMLRRPR